MPSDRDDTSERILDAALAQFAGYGLRRTTMEDISARAGMGRATLYRHFRDKDAVFSAVIFREMQQHLAFIDKRVRQQPNALEGLLEAFVLAVRRLGTHPLLVRLLDSEPDTVLPHLTRQMGNTFSVASAFLVAQILAAQARGELRQLPAPLLADMLLRLVQSFMLGASPQVDVTSDASVRAFAEACLRPLLTP